MSDPNVMVKGTDNKSGEVLQKTRVLSPHEVEDLEKALLAHQQVLGASDSAFSNGAEGASPIAPPELRINRRKLNEQAAQIKRVLETCRPQPIPEKDKDRYHQRSKWLESKFGEYLETRAEIHVTKRDRAEWQSATEKARIRTSVKPEIERYIEEWKSIQRLLSPGDPNADNLHRLRKDR